MFLFSNVLSRSLVAGIWLQILSAKVITIVDTGSHEQIKNIRIR